MADAESAILPLAVPPFRVALVVPLAVAAAVPFACGGGIASTGAPADAAAEVNHVPKHFEAGADERAADAPAEYEAQAPHCTRAAEAGAPIAFDAGADATPDVVALPLVVSLGGPTLHAPTFVSVTFPDEPLADPLEDYLASLGCTDYWRTVGADYGVGDAVAGPPVRLTEAAPSAIDDTGVRAWLKNKIDQGDPQFPRPAPDTVYVVFYPDATQVTLQGLTSCQEFDGYHEGGSLSDGTPFSYAVIPRCQGSGLDGLAMLTVAASHELVEACTDPQPDAVQPSYVITDVNHLGWALLAGAEVGDMCEFDPEAYFTPAGFPWMVQRIWSNRAAWAGSAPCVPSSSADYFYAAAVAQDAVTLAVTGTPQSYAAVHVPVGATATVAVQLVSNGPTGTMQLQAIDPGPLMGLPTRLGLTLDSTSAAPGTTVHLTIQKLQGDSSLGAEPFQLAATMNGRKTVSWGVTSD
jgi:hypothetical protein